MQINGYNSELEYTVIGDDGLGKVSTLRQRIFTRICMVISFGLIILGALAIINP